jgi:hypothetical protein
MADAYFSASCLARVLTPGHGLRFGLHVGVALESTEILELRQARYQPLNLIGIRRGLPLEDLDVTTTADRRRNALARLHTERDLPRLAP